MPRANGIFARGLMRELRALTPWSGQILQAVEGSQRDHIEVDQVQLRKGQGGDRLPGGFLAWAFEQQHHSVWLVCTGVEFADDALFVEFPDGLNFCRRVSQHLLSRDAFDWFGQD